MKPKKVSTAPASAKTSGGTDSTAKKAASAARINEVLAVEPEDAVGIVRQPHVAGGDAPERRLVESEDARDGAQVALLGLVQRPVGRHVDLARDFAVHDQFDGPRSDLGHGVVAFAVQFDRVADEASSAGRRDQAERD